MFDLEKFSPVDELNSLSDAEFWRALQGKLPCLEYTAACVDKIQSLAVSASPLLSSIDTKLEEIQTSIDNAQVATSESEKLAILKPALLYFATPETISIVVNGQTRTQQRGILNRLADVVMSPGKVVNELVGAIAKPAVDAITGGSAEVRQSNVAIANLTAQLSNLRIERQKLELQVRALVDERLAVVDAAIRDYKLALNDLLLERKRSELYRLSFVQGIGDPSQMMALESAVDSHASQAIASFSRMRTAVNRLKTVAYGSLELE